MPLHDTLSWLRQSAAMVGGVIDLASGAMVFTIASGLGIVAPPVLGGFGTALTVGVAGAVSLGFARAIAQPGRVLRIVASGVRGAALVGQILVLVSATGVAPVIVSAIVSILASITLAVAVWLPVLAERHQASD